MQAGPQPHWGSSPSEVTSPMDECVTYSCSVLKSVNLLQQNMIVFLHFFPPIWAGLVVFASVSNLDPNHSMFHSNVNPSHSITTFQNPNKKGKISLYNFCDLIAPGRPNRMLLLLPGWWELLPMWEGPTGCSMLHKTLIVLIFTAETTSHCPARLFQSPQKLFVSVSMLYI